MQAHGTVPLEGRNVAGLLHCRGHGTVLPQAHHRRNEDAGLRCRFMAWGKGSCGSETPPGGRSAHNHNQKFCKARVPPMPTLIKSPP